MPLALEWVPSVDGEGLGLIGETGVCKTRTCFLILDRLHHAGIRVEAVSSVQFAKLCADQFADDFRSKGEAREKITACHRARVLLIDDVGKERFTQRVATEFFHLIEERLAHHRATLWTTNLDAGALKHAFADDTKSDPIVRRLREFSEMVEL